MKLRSGASLPELILVAWLFGLVLAAVAGFAAGQRRIVEATSGRVRMSEVVRVADRVLGSELRTLAEADIERHGPSSIGVRAVRGGGVICGWTSDGALVRYKGMRRPDATKDSVILISGRTPRGEPYRLLAAASEQGCGGSVVRLRLQPAPSARAAGGLALVFESGTYSVDDAIRYRRGAAGRQPLTETVLSDADLAWPAGGDFGLRFGVRSLPGIDSSRSVTLSLRRLNAGGP